jgi:hypothetical protein
MTDRRISLVSDFPGVCASRRIPLGILVLAALTGCAGKGTTPVKGVVMLEGTPVADATVVFMPDGQGGGRPASGFTLSDGGFQLTTYQLDDGALPGTYRVLVQKTAPARDPGTAERSALEKVKAKYTEKSSPRVKTPGLPSPYTNFETTPLRCTVPVTGLVTLALRKDGKAERQP